LLISKIFNGSINKNKRSDVFLRSSIVVVVIAESKIERFEEISKSIRGVYFFFPR